MIQRIQSVYLLLIIVISAVMLFVPIMNYELINKPDHHYVHYYTYHIVHEYGNEELMSDTKVYPNYYILILDGLTGLVSFLTIFLFKNRKHQIKHCWFIIILLLLMLLLFFVVNGLLLMAFNIH